jgi:adenine-specific DNA-methyltransferase
METYKDHITISPDLNAERLDTLKKLFPDWFTQEGYLDVNEVKKAANPNSVEETERYEFRWFGKSKAKRNAFTPTRATLHFDATRSVNADNTENIIIEGENLEVLKILISGYRNKIQCIYIDPPYNADALTAYNDNFKQDRIKYWEENNITENGIFVDTETVPEGRKHSIWMSDIL